jgi:hypothetical protein
VRRQTEVESTLRTEPSAFVTQRNRRGPRDEAAEAVGGSTAHVPVSAAATATVRRRKKDRWPDRRTAGSSDTGAFGSDGGDRGRVVARPGVNTITGAEDAGSTGTTGT